MPTQAEIEAKAKDTANFLVRFTRDNPKTAIVTAFIVQLIMIYVTFRLTRGR